MGTNYYVDLPGVLSADGVKYTPSRNLHIAKISGPDTGSLVAYRSSGRDEIAGRAITSFQDWREVLATPGAVIYDEYHEVLSAEKLLARFEGFSPDGRRRSYHWMLDHPEHQRFDRDGNDLNWSDIEGYSFYDGEYS